MNDSIFYFYFKKKAFCDAHRSQKRFYSFKRGKSKNQEHLSGPVKQGATMNLQLLANVEAWTAKIDAMISHGQIEFELKLENFMCVSVIYLFFYFQLRCWKGSSSGHSAKALKTCLGLYLVLCWTRSVKTSCFSFLLQPIPNWTLQIVWCFALNSIGKGLNTLTKEVLKWTK